MDRWQSTVNVQLAKHDAALVLLEANHSQTSRLLEKMEQHVRVTSSALDKIQGGWALFKWIIGVLLALIALEIGLAHGGNISTAVQHGFLRLSSHVSTAVDAQDRRGQIPPQFEQNNGFLPSGDL